MILNEKTGDLMGADNQKQLERQETLEAIGKLNLLDDNLMTLVFDDLAEKRAEKRAEEARIEEKKAFARRLIARGKQTVEEIAEDADLPIEVVRELAGLQLA